MLRSKPIPFLVLALAACGGDEDLADPGGEAPPDLTGSYTLQSFSAALLTGGDTLETSDTVSGTFTVRQETVAGSVATGTMAISLVLPDGQGETTSFEDRGGYLNRSDGRWSQTGDQFSGQGTYELQGDALHVEVIEPALAAAYSVWRRN